MKISIAARKMELTDALKAHVEAKMAKLDKFFPDGTEAKVTLSVQKSDQRVEATIFSQGFIYRVEDATPDMYATVDKIVMDIERQIRKHKTRLERRLRQGSLDDLTSAMVKVEEETEFNIVRHKEVFTKPMSAEEAILQMNLLGHSFFVFTDDTTESTCIVYRRKGGDYGLLELK